MDPQSNLESQTKLDEQLKVDPQNHLNTESQTKLDPQLTMVHEHKDDLEPFIRSFEWNETNEFCVCGHRRLLVLEYSMCPCCRNTTRSTSFCIRCDIYTSEEEKGLGQILKKIVVQTNERFEHIEACVAMMQSR